MKSLAALRSGSSPTADASGATIPRRKKPAGRSFAAVLPVVLGLLMPKCPMCFFALGALTTWLGIDSSGYELYSTVFLGSMLMVFLIWNGLRRQGRDRWLCLAMMGLGACLFFAARRDGETNLLLAGTASVVYLSGAFYGQRRCQKCAPEAVV